MTDYQKSESKAVSAIRSAIPPSLKKDMLSISQGKFAEIFQNDEVFPNHFLACAIDGVGTKIVLAEAMDIYDTIGIDCVAMSANDLATLGPVSPFIFMDCLSTQSKALEKTGEIIKGISKGLEQCDASNILKNSIRMNFGKGETASVGELISGTKPEHGFDLVGSMIGFIEKNKLNTKVNDGDKIIALKSSGLHSNGYTSARHSLLNGDFETRPDIKKLYKGKFKLNDKFESSTIGKTLLEPTKIYIKEIAKISKDFNIVGINNTGYGLKNLNRITGFQFTITNPIEPQPIFNLIQKESSLSDEKMYSTYNMGMGFFIIADKADAENIIQSTKDSQIIGEVKKSNKTITILEKDNQKINFERY